MAGLVGLSVMLGGGCLAAPPLPNPPAPPPAILRTPTPPPAPSPARPVLQPPVSPSSSPLAVGRIPVAAPSPLAFDEAVAIAQNFDRPQPDVESLTIEDIDRLSPTNPMPEDRRRIFLVTLSAQPATGESLPWEPGRNLRWVELVRGPNGDWSVGTISPDPLPPVE